MSQNGAFLNHSLRRVSYWVLAVKHGVEFWQVTSTDHSAFQVVYLPWQTQEHWIVVHSNHFAEKGSLEVFDWLPLAHFLKSMVQVDWVVAWCLLSPIFRELVNTVKKYFFKFFDRHSGRKVLNHQKRVWLPKEKFLTVLWNLVPCCR